MTGTDDLTAFAREWPDYPLDQLPPLPADFGFYWSAMYPMFSAPDLRLGVIVEYPDHARREDPDLPRFILYADGPEDGDLPTDLLQTDNWNAVLGHIDRFRKNPPL